MDHLNEGRQVPGLFILQRKMSIQETVDELALIWLVAASNQDANLINFLPISL